MNAVCQPRGVAEAVLIRAVEVALGEEFMRERRPVEAARDLTNGPGKLCVAMDINRGLDGVDLCDASSPLFIARNPAVEKFRQGAGADGHGDADWADESGGFGVAVLPGGQRFRVAALKSRRR